MTTPKPPAPHCAHESFSAAVGVHRVQDGPDKPIDFNADVRIKCAQCGLAFRFIGLPRGLNFDGPGMSVDGTEAHLAISPDGLPSLAGGLRGFTVKGPNV